ncbi:hypothetical protein BST61_g7273 [Cercospora zeina]
MAGEFLRQHGIDIDAEMAKIQFGSSERKTGEGQTSIEILSDVSLPETEGKTRWAVHLADGCIRDIVAHQDTAPQATSVDAKGALLAPSLCHPHIHIDKAYLLSHPKYADLQLEKGGFQEAMDLTGKAKARFETDDLLERGQRLVDESVAAGVTHMRAFVEVDAGVQLKCLDAGIELQERAANGAICKIQICAFAQLPLFSPSGGDEDGAVIRDLMRQAVVKPGVTVIGSTPYVETDRDKMQRNVEWMVDLSIEHNVHLDFHLDYNLDQDIEPLVWFVVQTLKERGWKDHTSKATIVLGHCTRLALFGTAEWEKLAQAIKDAQLPISFVGLPTSDLFMMRTGKHPEIRGSLNVPRLIKEYGLNACIGVNNIGNAFTPQGTCDPLSLACQGVGIYQAGTKRDAEILYECVSTRARAAIGFSRSDNAGVGLALRPGDKADLILFGAADPGWRTRTSRCTCTITVKAGRHSLVEIRPALGGETRSEVKDAPSGLPLAHQTDNAKLHETRASSHPAAPPRSFRLRTGTFSRLGAVFAFTNQTTPTMAPMVLDYDRDGNVVGGHTVDELPDHLYSSRPRRSVNMADSTPRLLPGAQPSLEQRGAAPHFTHYQYAAAPNLYHQHGLPNGNFLTSELALPALLIQPRQEVPSYLSRSLASSESQAQSEPQHANPPYGPHDLRRDTQTNSQRYGFVANPLAAGTFNTGSYDVPRAPDFVDASRFESAGYHLASQHLTYGQSQQYTVPQLADQRFQQQYVPSYEPVPHNGNRGRPGSRGPYGFPHPDEAQSMVYHQQHHRNSLHDGGALDGYSDRVYRPVQPAQLSPPYLGPASSYVPDSYNVDPRMLPAHPASRQGSTSAAAMRRSEHTLPSPMKSLVHSSPRQTMQHAGDEDMHSVGSGSTSEADANSQKSEDAYVPPKISKQSKKRAKTKGRRKAAARVRQRCADCRARHKKCTHKTRPSAIPGLEASEILPEVPIEASNCENVAAEQESHGDNATTPASETSITEVARASPQTSLSEIGDDIGSTVQDSQHADAPAHAASVQAPPFAYEDHVTLENIENEQQSNKSVQVDSKLAEHASSFLDTLHARLESEDPATLEHFMRDAKLYKAGFLNGEQFYSNTYKLLHHADIADLLPQFAKCLPTRWDEAAVALLNATLDRELGSDAVSAENKLDSPNVAQPVKRKRRPLNAFKASENFVTADEETNDAPGHEPSTADFVRATPPESPKSTVYARSGKMSGRKAVATPQKGRKLRARATPNKTSKATAVVKSFGKKKHYIGHLLSTEVDHVGPVYTTRREIMSRTSRPYIHGACGQCLIKVSERCNANNISLGRGFAHPQDLEDNESEESDDDAEHESDDEFEDFSTTEPTVLPYPPVEKTASVHRPRSSMTAPHPRKRAASNVPARPQKRTIVKAGSDEIVGAGATTVTSPLAPASVSQNESTKETAIENAESSDEEEPSSSIVSRAAALGLRTSLRQ